MATGHGPGAGRRRPRSSQTTTGACATVGVRRRRPADTTGLDVPLLSVSSLAPTCRSLHRRDPRTDTASPPPHGTGGPTSDQWADTNSQQTRSTNSSQDRPRGPVRPLTEGPRAISQTFYFGREGQDAPPLGGTTNLYRH